MTLAFPTILSLLIVNFISINNRPPLLSAAQSIIKSESENPDFDDVDERYCDTEFCDTIVNKCVLTQKCSCDFKNDAPCAKDCIDCLEEKFAKCCACVKLCPALNSNSDTSATHVGSITRTDEALFEVLTETDDIYGRYRVLHETMIEQVHQPDHGHLEFAYRATNKSDKHNTYDFSHDLNLDKLECHIAFINKELGLKKCKKSCTSMGASYFRWFYEGCCECVGKYCLRYGIDRPECIIKY